MDAPIMARWNAETETFAPLPHYRKRCNATFVDTALYTLAIHEEQSSASRGHYFAALKDKWLTLPESLAQRFPSAEALRKYALIQCGYRDERSFVAGSPAEALKLAAYLRSRDDEYAIISVNDCVVVEWIAKSQKIKAMSRREFQESKSRVLDYIDADLLGVEREQAA